MKIEEVLKTVTQEIANMISTKTVVGEHITIEGRTIIPITKVTFGFGSGGGEGRSKSSDEGSGAGGGGGACIQPVAFLVVTKEDVQLLTIKGKSVITQIGELIPEIMEKYRSIKEEQKKDKPEREQTGS